MDADPVELRILGCLVEKQRTTPDQYPLSLNSLRLACNQATNRDPVVEYDEETIKVALRRLTAKQWVRLASGPSSRASKYRHLLDEALQLSDEELSLLAVLMLRGSQTVGELKARSERMHRFESLAQVHEVLERLIEREFAVRLPRRPGQKEERFALRVEGDLEEPEHEAPAGDLSARVARLEAEVAELREELRGLRGAAEDGEPPQRAGAVDVELETARPGNGDERSAGMDVGAESGAPDAADEVDDAESETDPRSFAREGEG